jgi:hypothetical protein
MSQVGAPTSPVHNKFPKLMPDLSRPQPGRWIKRHRSALEATATMALAMSAPVLAAVATFQTAV